LTTASAARSNLANGEFACPSSRTYFENLGQRVLARDHELSVSESGFRQLTAMWMELADTQERFRIFGLEGLQKILGLFLVLIEIGMER